TPQYPFTAKRMGKEGKVILKLTIDERGRLINVEIIESAAFGMTDAAVDAVKHSTFIAAKVNDKPVKSTAILPITFKLQ
ncbi:TonB-like protein, partial [Candidatus Magnetoovum chiemensis]